MAKLERCKMEGLRVEVKCLPPATESSLHPPIVRKTVSLQPLTADEEKAWDDEQAVAKAVRAEKNAEEKATREPKKRAKPMMKPAADAPEAEWDAWKKECDRLDKKRIARYNNS